MSEDTFKVGHITFTRASKKACEDAHIKIAHSHYWGDRSNAGKNYVRGKNASSSAGDSGGG